jgi:hypothetical protein
MCDSDKLVFWLAGAPSRFRSNPESLLEMNAEADCDRSDLEDDEPA